MPDKLRAVAQLYIDTIHAVENRCMAADGPVTPTHQEITDDELRRVYVAAVDALGVKGRDDQTFCDQVMPNPSSQKD